jgi:HYDIN/CFA65/VesB family protein
MKKQAVRTRVVISILLAVSGIIALPGRTRIGVGLTHGNQDPATPPSPPYVNLNPDNLDFGDQVVRRTSAAKRITVKNTGGKPLYFDSVTLGGDNPNAFAIATHTCSGATVDPNKACILDVTFTPSVTGGRNARLRLNDNALDSPQRLKLKGNGINSNDVPPF